MNGRIVLLVLLGLPPLSFLFAADAPHARPALHAETTSAAPGQPVWVAVRFEMDPGWHVYWKNPGDSGLATSVTWSLPDGVSAGPLQYPSPERIEIPPLISYGYEKEAVFLARLDVPGNFKGRRLEVSIRADWLECADVCLPGRADLRLSLPVAPGPPGPDPAQAELFARARFHLPLPSSDWTVRAFRSADRVRLLLRPSAGPPPAPEEVEFFPEDNTLVESLSAKKAFRSAGGLVLEYPLSTLTAGKTPDALKGVLVSRQGWRGPGSERGLDVSVPLEPWEAAPPLETTGSPVTFLAALALAFLGGMLLNLMPCVLPILSIKILGFLQRTSGDATAARRHGFLYAAGVLASFWALAGLLAALRAAGHGLGWGFQLQSPVFVGLLALLFLALALNLFGFFEIGTSLTRLGGGSGGAFGGGVLAVLVATPCTAPFMGAALGYAVTRPLHESFAVFTSLGLGMAWPYAALSASPRLLRWVPKPGPWMVVLKRIMGLLLLGAALWLGAVLARQTGLLVKTAEGGGLAWEPFSPARVRELQAAGKPLFIDFTADWCLTCQVNDRVALRRPEVVRRFRGLGVVPLKADWTSRDEAITRALQEHGRSGVPLYVLYGRGTKPPRLLPAILTPDIVLKALDEGLE